MIIEKTTMKPDEIDLLSDTCPVGTTIIIEGEGRTLVSRQKKNIFHQIAQARAVINRRGVVASAEFLGRITITGINPTNRTLTVRIAPPPAQPKKP